MEMVDLEKNEQNVGVIHSGELHVGEALLPYNTGILENHIRVEDSYTIGERSATRTFEGRAEDVLKTLAFFKEEKSND